MKLNAKPKGLRSFRRTRNERLLPHMWVCPTSDGILGGGMWKDWHRVDLDSHSRFKFEELKVDQNCFHAHGRRPISISCRSLLCNNKSDTRKHDVTLHESQVYVNVSRNQARALSTKACRGEQISGYQKISTSDMMGRFWIMVLWSEACQESPTTTTSAINLRHDKLLRWRDSRNDFAQELHFH
jgi:hypothetical protein